MTADEAEKLATRAAEIGKASGADILVLLNKTLLQAAQLAVDQTIIDLGRTDETSSDVAQVRAALSSELETSQIALVFHIRDDMQKAIQSGYHAEVIAQNAALPGGIELSSTIDTRMLEVYPVMGATATEVAMHNARVWRFGAESAAGQAAALGDPSILPVAFATLAERTAGVAARAVEEAFVAGQQAARRAVGLALSRVFAHHA